MRGRSEPSQRQRKPDDADLTAVTGSMAPSTDPFVAKSPPPPAPPPTSTGTTGSHGSLTNSLHGTSSLLMTTPNRHKHLDTEVTSAVSSTASSAKTPPRSNPGDDGSGQSAARDETMYLLLGSIQGLIGVVMAVFGVMALMRDASMASTGAGIWGGAVALASGTIGVVAGLRSCYSRSGSRESVAPTAFMASSLVTIASANLVLVLTAIGLARDFRHLRPEQTREGENEDDSLRGIVASCGLVLASALQLLVNIASAYRCYRVVCPCASRRHEPLYNQSCAGSPDSLRSTLKSNTKDRLVSHWLTGASDAPATATATAANLNPTTPVFPGSPTPSGLLLFSTQPPPPGHHPQTVYSLPPPPPPQGIPVPIRYQQYPMMIQARPRPRVMRSAQPSRLSPLPLNRRRHHQGHGSHDRRRPRREGHRNKSHSGRTSPSPVTAAQVAKTYTGLDRKMAEDFLTVLDHGRNNTGSRPKSSSSSKPQGRLPAKTAHTPASATPDDF